MEVAVVLLLVVLTSALLVVGEAAEMVGAMKAKDMAVMVEDAVGDCRDRGHWW